MPASDSASMTGAIAAESQDIDPRRWRVLLLLAAAELLGMSVWFAASAVAVPLAARWALSESEIAWLTSSVQLGFVLGTATLSILNLADIVPSRVLFSTAALTGAAANAALVMAPSYGAALACRLATGFALAGVYPPAMKMISTWFRARRGLAVGAIVGALTVGKATPYLVHAIHGAGVTPVVLTASAAATLAAVLVAVGYRDGPYPFASRRFSWGLVGTVLSARQWRLATGGYLGHMFELYSAWTWLPLFIAASAVASGMPENARTSSIASAVAFGAIAIGGLACIWGGLVADRRGREWLVTIALAASGSSSILIGFTFGRALWLVVIMALVWGFFVIADSAQFSVLVTESVPSHAVGTALTVQTCIGFLLTMFSIQMIPPLERVVGWRWAFAVLSLGPVFGIAAIRRLVAVRSGAGRGGVDRPISSLAPVAGVPQK
jgi:MFS family permease